MTVTGRTYRFSQLVRNGYDLIVVIYEILLCSCSILFISQHKAVVSQRLYLQVIVKGCCINQLCVVHSAYHALKYFSHDTGASDNESFPVFPE